MDTYQWAWFLGTGGFGFFSLTQLWPHVDLIEILPGEHVLSVSLYSSSSVTYGNYVRTTTLRSVEPLYLKMDAEPGHRYRLQGDEGFSFMSAGLSTWSALLEDISGERPLPAGVAVRISQLDSNSVKRVAAGSGNTPTASPAQAGGDRAAFEQALEQKIDSGELNTRSLTVTYPDRTTQTFGTNSPPNPERIRPASQ